MFSRVVLSLVFLMMLPQCGFQPMFGAGNEDLHAEFAVIQIDPIENREGQIMRMELKKALHVRGAQTPAQYRLKARITTSDKDLTYLSDQTAGRKSITASISYSLQESASGKILTSGSLSKTAEYNVASASSFGTIVSAERVKQDAIVGGVRDLKVALADYFIKARLASTESTEDHEHSKL